MTYRVSGEAHGTSFDEGGFETDVEAMAYASGIIDGDLESTVEITREDTMRPCGTLVDEATARYCGHENAEHITCPTPEGRAVERDCSHCECEEFTDPTATPLQGPDGSTYAGVTCTNLSAAGDWCGWCVGCRTAMAWLLDQRTVTR